MKVKTYPCTLLRWWVATGCIDCCYRESVMILVYIYIYYISCNIYICCKNIYILYNTHIYMDILLITAALFLLPQVDLQLLCFKKTGGALNITANLRLPSGCSDPPQWRWPCEVWPWQSHYTSAPAWHPYSTPQRPPGDLRHFGRNNIGQTSEVFAPETRAGNRGWCRIKVMAFWVQYA